jgi:flagellar hook-basal body complex protein FliE
MNPIFTALQAASQGASQTSMSPFGGALSGDASLSGSSFATPQPIGSFALNSAASLAPTGATASSAPFSDLLVQSVGQVDQLERAARTSIEGLISGKGVDVHEAMIATEKAEMGFDMVVAVREKALAAYQQVMSMLI